MQAFLFTSCVPYMCTNRFIHTTKIAPQGPHKLISITQLWYVDPAIPRSPADQPTEFDISSQAREHLHPSSQSVTKFSSPNLACIFGCAPGAQKQPVPANGLQVHGTRDPGTCMGESGAVDLSAGPIQLTCLLVRGRAGGGHQCGVQDVEIGASDWLPFRHVKRQL
jgi:hypothetical protein